MLMKLSQQMADRRTSVPCFVESFIMQTYVNINKKYKQQRQQSMQNNTKWPQ